ncbi:MAG: beta-glucosidase [Candidatus Hodarchaeota archaeon]
MEDMPFLNSSLDIDVRVADLLQRLTLEEKFKIMTGHRFFQTHSIKRLGIKPFKMTDGPLGVSMHSSGFRKNTRFPGGICLAATWNRHLAHDFGVAAAKEARALGRHCVLSPGINIDRSPLCGRTFEYLSEDPYLTKELATPYVKGMQSQRIAACLKHYVANNQETNRYTISAEIDERTLHEIYLKAFMGVIEETDPWVLMTAYNKVNNKYLFENKALLSDLVWNAWGFSGFIVSDWYALQRADPQALTEDCVKAGLSLEMPKAHVYKPTLLQTAYNEGKITNEDLNEVIRRLLRVMFLVGLFDDKSTLPKGKRNSKDHQELTRRMAEEGIVLLKNENNLLPLDITKISSIAVLGPNKDKKFGKLLYGGSSAVKPPYEVTPIKGLKNKCKDKIKITSSPSQADFVIIFAGLNHNTNKSLVRRSRKDLPPEGHDSEGIDRNKLELPVEQIELIKETVKANSNTIVVLFNGTPVAMDDWLDRVPVVIEAWYPGMEGGNAIANILFGDVNPSGKLPVTFPKTLSDSPAHKSIRTFPGENLEVYYEEEVYVGYRHFDKTGIEPLYPFGFGLSYTDFSYSNLRLNKKVLSGKNDSLILSIDITNNGRFTGSEIIQIYSHDLECSINRPIKELIAFEKVNLKKSEQKTLKIPLNAKELSFYDVIHHSWTIEPGNFEIYVGKSSKDVSLRDQITYQDD